MSHNKDKIIILDLWPEEDDKLPAKFYVVNAMGDFVFIKARERKKAQEIVDIEFGKGHYTVRVVQKAIVR